MTVKSILTQIALGENSTHQFKVDVRNGESLAAEMAAFANSGGGTRLGVLMFAERPEWIKPQFVLKAIRYPGNQIHVSEYVDAEDFAGPLPTTIMRNMKSASSPRPVCASSY